MSAKKVAEALSGVLADSYVLQVKTQNYHWNVVGPYFHSLHLLFESQYNELFAAVDEIAERIRQLGFHTPGTLSEFLRLSVVSEASSDAAPGMVADLAACNDKICGRLSAALKAAEDMGDDATVDLMVRRLQAHGKAVWMLRATLGDEATAADVATAAVTRSKPAQAKPKKTTKAVAAKAPAPTAKSVKAAKPKAAPKQKPKAAKKPKVAPKVSTKPKGKVAMG
ncbi:MAG: DNA starvation/stationary phase protection protein [Armatimonadetes bacterium]|nr:DNA starvation/stationary phase protection protein [Armatimonadota bacterium]